MEGGRRRVDAYLNASRFADESLAAGTFSNCV